MMMDGVPRPSQMYHVDGVGYQNAAAQAAQEARKKERVRQSPKVGKNSVRNQLDASDPVPQSLLDEDVRRVLEEDYSLRLDENRPYQFIYDETQDVFHLMDMSTHTIILTLTPEEFLQVSASLQRSAGVMSDHSA